jgi:hypothetical protein
LAAIHMLQMPLADSEQLPPNLRQFASNIESQSHMLVVSQLMFVHYSHMSAIHRLEISLGIVDEADKHKPR